MAHMGSGLYVDRRTGKKYDYEQDEGKTPLLRSNRIILFVDKTLMSEENGEQDMKMPERTSIPISQSRSLVFY